MENADNRQSDRLLRQAYGAWRRLGKMRETRLRNKNYTYGNQWCDLMTDERGRRLSEYDYLRQNGKEPLTNNLIRQLVKSVVGRFRKQLSEEPAAGRDFEIDELDSRAMEEFLISGCCFQRVERRADGGARTENVNPAKVFLNHADDPLGRDCDLIGELHDMTLAEIVGRLADGSREKALRICRLYEDGAAEGGSEMWDGVAAGRVRVMELWKRESREGYDCHDRLSGEWFFSQGASVPDCGSGHLECRWGVRDVWRCYWIAPGGHIISQYDSPYRHGSHPYAFKLYPLTDDEVHSMVEDVIDQQKYVNRLITLVDHIMGTSAKGVLLYPDNILPEGYTWDDLRHAWSKPNAIVPYHPHGGSERPQQISTNATNIGAYEMVNLQMRLFEQISGVSGAMQGQSVSAATGAKLYESYISNSTIALSDIFESFNSFRRERDRKAASL